ncbi:MAG: DUF6383 domain-containing protein [Paludibacteraceae bacterium]|nr:DUF6383 domain-containing protein [Paludibacteraceae bacterium]
MTIRQVIVCACLFFGSVMVHAAPKQLNVLLQSGEIVSVKFDENSAIRFSDGIMNIDSDSTTRILISEIDNLYFSELTLSDISEKKVDYGVFFDRESGSVCLSGVMGKSIMLSNVNGTVFYTKQSVNDIVTVPVPSSKGVYILKVDKQSYKIIKY